MMYINWTWRLIYIDSYYKSFFYQTLASSNQTAINLDQLRVARDKYPEYREMARRIATFKLWNGPDVDLYDLARAGLIYQGTTY